MEKLLFCLKCQSLMNKIEPLGEDMLAVQKVLVNHSSLKKDKLLLFNQWKCKCGGNTITVE